MPKSVGILRNSWRLRDERGFTLIDMLFVVALVGLLSVLALPGILRARGAAQASSALGTMRAINSGQLSYAITCGLGFYAPDLPTLGVKPPASNAAFLPDGLTSGPTILRHGYSFAVTGTPLPGAPATCNGLGVGQASPGYAATADPIGTGATGRYFATNAEGLLYEHTATLNGIMPESGTPLGGAQIMWGGVFRRPTPAPLKGAPYALRTPTHPASRVRVTRSQSCHGGKRMLPRRARLGAVLAAALAVAGSAAAQTITTPKQHFGFNIGDDYQLATYDQLQAYWQKLDKESPRMQVIEIGKTEEGRPHLAAIVTAAENFKGLDRYKQISQQLHRARGLSDEQARALAKEGKAVVWIDGGLHATEVVGAHQLMETVYQLASRTDDETNRILRDVIVIAVHANPDGMQMVSKCYMQNPDPQQRRTCSPRLYEKYAGHDNNRDFYMANTKETQNMNKLMYWEWLPQIMYNHHQSGPAGTVIFSPPFRDPFNYNFDPMIVTGLDMVGAAMHHRFLQEGKPGFTMRSGASYSTWWNGGLRTTAYFQNIIGLLTEIIGNPTPSSIPATMNTIMPRGDLPAPIAPQEWKFRQSIDYSVTANYAVLDLASRYKDQFLFNIYRMGKNQIERGSRDHWTISEEDMDRLRAAIAPPAQNGGQGRGAAPAQGGGRGRGGLQVAQVEKVMKDPARRDPRVFIIPSAQADFPTATKFINALRYVGVEVHQANAAFSANGKNYPAGSYVVKTAQAGRAHVLDMFEPQDHPNDMDERGVPRRPYDSAGWTLAYQMGITFDRVFDDVNGPFTEIQGLAKPVPGQISGTASAGYLISPKINDAFTIANRVMKANGEVYRLGTPMTANDKTYPVGSFYIVASAASTPVVQAGAKELGVDIDATGDRPSGSATRLAPKRIALWDTQTGSMPSGWTRFLLERFEFPFTVVCGAGFDDSALRSKYDVIIMPSGASFRAGGGRGGRGGGGNAPEQPAAKPTDPDLRSLCEVTSGTGTGAAAEANVRKFVEQGGVVVAAGSAAEAIAATLDLPVTDYMVDRQPNEEDRPLGSEKFYVPGSVVRVAVDTTAPSAIGAEDHVDVYFNNSPVFRLAPNAAAMGLRPVMWFDSAAPLRSGWAWGQNYLEGGTTAFEAPVGQGKAFVFGPEITFRAQPHGTFKFLFNAIHGVARTGPPSGTAANR